MNKEKLKFQQKLSDVHEEINEAWNYEVGQKVKRDFDLYGQIENTEMAIDKCYRKGALDSASILLSKYRYLWITALIKYGAYDVGPKQPIGFRGAGC
jgi:hypothetical protein